MRKIVLVALILSGAVFALSWIWHSSEDDAPRLTIGINACDYRIFITKCLVEERPYHPVTINAHDACYPPIAYCLSKCFPLTPCGEVAYISFLFAGLTAGLAFFMIQRKQKNIVGLMCAVALTIPFASGPIRGNPAAWAAGALFVFLAWYDATVLWKRMVAAIALGFAASLKLTPVVYGLLYLRGRLFETAKWPKEEIFVSIMSFTLLFAVPFVFWGGPNEVDAWLRNALGNSRHYSPLADYGLVPFVHFFSSYLPRWSLPLAVHLTNLLALLLCFASCFAKRLYHSLALLGVAMVFLCHHDYGLAYLLPAFACWLADDRREMPANFATNSVLVIESVLWFLILESGVCAVSLQALYFNERILSNGAVVLLGFLCLAHTTERMVGETWAKCSGKATATGPSSGRTRSSSGS